MAQKHLQLLRNNNVYGSYGLALAALTGWDFTNKPLADGTPILARYTDNENNQQTLLGVVNNGTIDIINNVADYLLRNYTAFSGDVTTITSADDVKTAIAKLEKHIADVAADITVTVEEAQDANTQAHLDITATTSTTEGDTYTIGLKDVASESALTAEITARKAVDGQSGQTYAANTGASYISNALSLNDADVKLDAALKAEETERRKIEGQSGSTYTPNSSSSYISAATSLNDADVKLNAAVESLSGAVSNLDASTVFDESKVVIDVTQQNGQITATADNLTGVKLAGYEEGTDADVAATDTLGQALGKLQAQINAMDKTASAVAGQVVTTVEETDGKVTETKANVKDLQLGGYSKTNDTGAISGTDTVNVALSKLENQIGQNAIGNGDGSINVSATTNGTDINVNIKSGEHVLAKGGDAGLYTDLDLIKITGGTLPTNVKERYQLLATDDTQIGQNIDIYKDNTLKSVALDDQELVFTYIVDSGESVVRVDVSKFLAETEFGSGVTANSDGYVHGVVDPTSETFLTVGTGGFKLSGVQDAIDDAIEALDVTGDTAVAGQYITHINETDGKIQIGGREDIADAPLNGYSKGTAPASLPVTASDTVNGAIAKLEHQVDAAKAAATTEVVEGTDAGNNLSISSSAASDGHVVYTVNLTDVASASALTAEIAARKAVDGVNGDAYTADTSAHYISGNSVNSLYAADKALDTALYNESSARTAAIQALDAEVSGGTGHVNVTVTEVDGVITDVAVAETDIASETELYALSAKTFTAAAMTGGTISTAATADGTVQLNINTDGSQVLLTNYAQGSDITAPAATDSVNGAIAKLYNKSVADHVVAGSATTVTTATTGTTVDVKLDTTSNINEYDADHAQAVNSQSKNVLEITANGLYLNNNWDCGTY